MENRLQPGSGNSLGWLVEIQGHCATVIPCLNEQGSISAVVRGALQQTRAVWVVDDGSSDRTKAEAENANAAVIRHEVNLGKGASLRDGLAAARAAGFTWAVIMDGDGQHDGADIPKLLQKAAGGVDLVIGNRMTNCEEMSSTRKFVNRWMSKRLGRRLGMACPDSQCGFRLVRLEAWAGLTLRQNRFEVESEMLLAFSRAGLKIAWTPVHCLPARRGSRIRPVADAARWFWWWFNSK